MGFVLSRPEKDHAAQLESFAELLKQHSEYRSNDSSTLVKLVLVGGVRNEGDASRVESLRSLAKDLNIQVSCVEVWKFALLISSNTLYRTAPNSL